MLEKPTLRMKFELEVPDPSGGPSQKYSVSRTLKAKWHDDPQKIALDVLNEIKNYKGSFVGDIIFALNAVFLSKGKPIEESGTRSLQVARWAAGVVESLIFTGISDEIHEELVENDELPEWDGTFRKIDAVKSEELKNVDVERVMILLAPKIKHALNIMSKRMK